MTRRTAIPLEMEPAAEPGSERGPNRCRPPRPLGGRHCFRHDHPGNEHTEMQWRLPHREVEGGTTLPVREPSTKRGRGLGVMSNLVSSTGHPLARIARLLGVAVFVSGIAGGLSVATRISEASGARPEGSRTHRGANL